MIDDLNAITTLETGLVGNLAGGNSPMDYLNAGYFLSKMVGYNDRQVLSNPWHLHRVDLYLVSIDSTKPGIVQTLGGGFNDYSLQPLVGSIVIDYSAGVVTSIRIGFDKWCMTRDCFTYLF